MGGVVVDAEREPMDPLGMEMVRLGASKMDELNEGTFEVRRAVATSWKGHELGGLRRDA